MRRLGERMPDSRQILIGADLKGQPIGQAMRLANRHGLVAGATGTGKTVTLQRLAEAFSDAGVAQETPLGHPQKSPFNEWAFSGQAVQSGQASAFDANQNNPADSATVAGRVSTHANRMLRTVPP
ncbi:uncharacterized protein DUF853 [Pseudomonas graminis]|nr:uncharacterized protein DUF853 [Pseudomonas graminis]